MLLSLPQAPEGKFLCPKAEIQEQIRSIYHSHTGVDGYRSMAAYLKRAGNYYCAAITHVVASDMTLARTLFGADDALIMLLLLSKLYPRCWARVGCSFGDVGI